MPAPEAASRLSLLDRQDVSAESAAIFDVFLQRRGFVPNMFRVWAHSPALLKQAAPLSWALLDEGALSGRYKELVAVYISRLEDCAYGVKAHEIQALRKGATAAEVDALSAPEHGPFSAAERLGFAYAGRVRQSAAAVDDEIFAELRQHFGEAQIVELTATVTGIIFFTRFIGALRIPVTPRPSA